ncbi:uncharacterized protein [Rutidosis leptorrhynchoides]|uniref:uncharacterized protein n=1 Tax=Rutidosis leptorrhynchoides TaxID=125765 RepID=UPI003A9A47AD
MIASKIGKPMLLDSYTSTMCMESWGRPNYARAMIEISAENDMRESLNIATPCSDGKKVVMDMVKIEYEWKPPRCARCKIFGHKDIQCPKNIPIIDTNKALQDDGFQLVNKKGSNNNANKELRTGFVMGKQKPKLIYKPILKPSASNTNKNTEQEHIGTSKSVESGEVEVNNPYDMLSGLQDEDNETIKLELRDELSENDIINDGKMHDVKRQNFLRGQALQSHVSLDRLNSICNAVFPRWSWTSNNNVCYKGTRIILGWDSTIVNLMVVNVAKQVMHCVAKLLADDKQFFVSFVYTANHYAARRDLWRDLIMHKSFVRQKPWVILGDFNASLSLEDTTSGSSKFTIAMREFN